MRLELLTRQSAANPKPAPLLFIHGAWHGAWCWDEYFLPYFAERGYASHALSLRGHGQSEGNLRWARIADYVADVRQVAEQLPTPPVLIGHSMGGFITQKYLEKYLAPAAVLLASIPSFGIFPLDLRLLRHIPLRFLQANLTLSGYPLIGTLELAHHSFFSAHLPAEKVRAYFDRLQDESMLAAYGATALELPRPAKVKAPLLILGAENDAIFPVSELEATARAYNTTAEIFPDMAHDMMLEPGWQKVADRILAWLNERGL
jgi:pimeloyl-ACP methyl ester carboxylesterase